MVHQGPDKEIWEEKVVWDERSNEARGASELLVWLPWIQWWKMIWGEGGQ